MIAYLEKYDTTAEVPDDISQTDLKDVNANFHAYVNPPVTSPSSSSTPPAADAKPASQPAAGVPPQKWQPNFYEGVIKPALTEAAFPTKDIASFAASPEGQAMGAKTVESLSFGALKPLLAIDPNITQAEKDHPAFAEAGTMAGTVGNLMVSGGAAAALKAGEAGAFLGKAAVEAGWKAGQRFIPAAIMGSATFGTRAAIVDIVRHFEEGGVNLEQFGKDVLKDSAFGGVFGMLGNIPNVAGRVSSAAGLFFTMAKMQGADNREASLQMGIGALYELIGGIGRNEEIRLKALGILKESIGEYAKARDPNIDEKDAQNVASHFVDNVMRKEGFDTAEDLAKHGPENLLEGIENVNQIVRTAHVPATPEEGAPALPKLPAPVSPEPPVTAPVPAKPQSPLEKVIEAIKGITGLKPQAEAPGTVPALPEGPRTYDEKIADLKAQGHDVMTIPPEKFPADLKDIYHYEQGKGQRADLEKGLGEIAERFQVLGIKPNEGAAIFDAYGLDKKGQLGQPAPLTDLVNKPIEEQYQEAYKILAAQRGLEPDSKPNAQIMDHAEKAVDLINGYFNPSSQMVFDFAKQHPEASDHDVAQMAHDRGLLGEPNPDLLKMEIEKAKQEKIISPMVASQENYRIYHGTSQKAGDLIRREGFKLSSEHGGYANTVENYISLTKDKETAEKFAEATGMNVDKIAGGKGVVLEIDKKSLRIADGNKYPQGDNEPWLDYLQRIKKEGFDAVDISNVSGYEGEGEIALINLEKAKLLDRIGGTNISAQLAHGGSIAAPSITIPPGTPKAEVAGTVEPKGLIRTYYEEIRNFIMPTLADPEGARILSASFSHAARQNDIAEFTMRAAKKFWGKQSHEDVIEFYDNFENGREQPEKWQVVGQMLREAYDKDRADVQALGEGKLEEFNKNYAAHYWEKAGKTAKISQGRRPFEGSKGFLKQRTFDTLKEGIEAGKTPLTWNPVELFEMKHAEMQKFVSSHKALQDAKRTGRTKFVRLGSEVPENDIGEKYVKINDPVGTVYKSPTVEVQEAYDQQMMDNLNTVAKSLGIDLERKANIRHKGVPMSAWGYSQSTQEGKPGKITSKFAGPESVIAHELGHQLDNIYGLQNKFLSDPKINHELSDLANQRITEVAKAREAAKGEYQGEGLAQTPKAFREYVQKPEEKMAAMLESYIHAPELLKEIAPNTFKKLTEFLKSDPKLAPLTEIRPSLLLGVNKGEVFAGGPVLVGNVYAEPNFARLFNNHLSKGLEQSAVFRGYRFLSNLVNQIQLFGGFHANFILGQSMATELDIALRQLFEGNLRGVVKGLGRTPIAPVELYHRGEQIMKAWRNEPSDPLTQRIADILEMSGGRIRMDDVYSTRAIEQMKHFFEQGRNIRGLLSVPFAAIDEANVPLLKMLVPHTKVAAFGRMMEMLLENNPNMTNEEAAKEGAKMWRTIEWRMGQVTYDNIFWDKTLKDALFFGIRSVGWNFGTAILGVLGIAGIKNLLKGKRLGDASEGYYALSYWIASAMITAMANAMYQRLMTGIGPQEAMDYLYPKNGGIKSDGKPSRSIPLQSYWPTLYNFAHNPKQTLVDKMNPVLQFFAQSLQNKDFFGEKIRDVQDDGVKGLLQALEGEAQHIARTIQPFGTRNMIHNLDEKNASLENVVGPWVGDVQSPYWVDQTKAEALAHEINADKSSVGGRSEEQIERSKLLSTLTRQYQMNDPEAQENLTKAYQEGLISHRQMMNVVIRSGMTPLQRMVKGMSLDEAERVYAKANDDEKAQIELILERKKVGHEREFVAQ